MTKEDMVELAKYQNINWIKEQINFKKNFRTNSI